MKKIVASVLLAGLFLGTASPVFAVETITQETNEGTNEGTTTLNSNVDANYSITIPSELTINLMSDSQVSDEGAIKLDTLTAAGTISVSPEVTDMTLGGKTTNVPVNETLPITLTDTLTPDSLDVISLNLGESQAIQVETNKTSQEVIAGTYEGNIVFSFTYEPEVE
jgi:hypothetical protein